MCTVARAAFFVVLFGSFQPASGLELESPAGSPPPPVFEDGFENFVGCGDGVILGGEQCDDFNSNPGDGCDVDCSIELGFMCAGVPSVCSTICGDGVIAGTELCDDNNAGDGDGCDASCGIENGYMCTGVPSVCNSICGDGVIAGIESCDDFNTNPGDGCDASCGIENGYMCTGVPSVCTML